MLGISSLSFLILTLIGAVVAVAYHDIVRYRFLEGRDAFFGKVIVGWLGAWLGSPVLGHWLWKIEGVYVVPAILGAIATIHMSTLLWKEFAKLAGIGLVVREEKKKEDSVLLDQQERLSQGRRRLVERTKGGEAVIVCFSNRCAVPRADGTKIGKVGAHRGLSRSCSGFYRKGALMKTVAQF